ncbi:MAG: S9 family peptidase [Planctomycetes bacterium]|nr:S9 family peptidase [Planctomycetota bacterium]
MRTLCCLLFCLVSHSVGLFAEHPEILSVDRIFSDEFRLDTTPSIQWLADGGYSALVPSEVHRGASDIARYDRTGARTIILAATSIIPPDRTEPLPIQGYAFSADQKVILLYTNSVKVWRQNTRGDYWVYELASQKLSKLGGEAAESSLMFAKLSSDGTRAGYVMANNIYIETIGSGTPEALTIDGTSEIINGTFDWVYEEEFDCRDGWRWSPDGTRIAYWQVDTHGVPEFTMVDNTSSKYPILKTFVYPKTGEPNASCRIGVVNAKPGSSTQWIDVPGDMRHDFYIPRMEWMESGNELCIQRINRLQNALDVMIANTDTGNVQTLLTERDAAWVDMPDERFDWIDHGRLFPWISERDGWRSLYLLDKASDSKSGGSAAGEIDLRRVTVGDFDVTRIVSIDDSKGMVYFIASPDNPTQRYLYSVPWKQPSKDRFGVAQPGSLQRVTPADQSGWHDYNISPDYSIAVHTYSSFGNPPRVELVSLPDHKTLRVFTNNDKARASLETLKQPNAEFFRVDIGEDVVLDGWMMKPMDFSPTKSYPLVFHVYGEPAGQTVVDRWGGNNYLWHLMLTQLGYVVVSVDNRGTPAPRGREWRKRVYRNIGTLASADQSAAAKKILAENPYIDPGRVGVWGWSGGGSMTLNLMFRSPDIYRAGISIAPVPDMRLYDTIYQERYMGLPDANGADYEKGSPISHVDGLVGDLLIVHGTGDDNCHYQGLEKLVDRLVESNKAFSMMAYPNRSHSINEGKNTSRHLYGMMTRFFRKHLPTDLPPAPLVGP